MKFTVFLVVFSYSILLLLQAKGCTAFPDSWSKVIQELCTTFQQLPPQIVYGHHYTQQAVMDPMILLMPPVILWSPTEQFPHLFTRNVLVCPDCEKEGKTSHLTAVRWKDGAKGQRTEPRKIHGRDGIVFLVARVYRCVNSHEILATDPRVYQKQLPLSSTLLPFSLWHITGYTRDVQSQIVLLITAGLSISAVRDTIQQQQYNTFLRSQRVYTELAQLYTTNGQITFNDVKPFPSFEQYSSQLPKSITPSRHAITGLFLADFDNTKETYYNDMRATTIADSDSWLSCDHTFACAGNVGFTRDYDLRWITQYTAMFCVLNECGQIVTWQFAHSVSFDNVRPILQRLKERFDRQSKKLNEFYIDNCCSWRKKIQSVFGNDVKVLLDLFHAIKRVGEKISKKHPLRKECMNALRMVFRDPTDLGKERQKPTPTHEVLLQQLESFVQAWDTAGFQGSPVLNEACKREVRNIKKHIACGCLSGIRPGRGTNRNENLHKNLNSLMGSSRYGVELANALIATCLHKHNMKRSSTPSTPVTLHQCTSLSTESFGLACTAQLSTVAAQENELNELYIHNSGSELLLCRLHSLNTAVQMNCEEAGDDNEHHDDTVENESTINIDTLTIKTIIAQSILWYYTHVSVSRQSTTASMDVRHMPFMHMNTDQVIENCLTEAVQHNEVLENTLAAWNFQQIQVDRDGNCLFVSVVTNLMLNGEHPSNKHLAAIHSTLPTPDNMMDVVKSLRTAIVNEWMGERTSQYQSFLTGHQLHEIATNYLSMGEFAGDVGDLILPALSNVLRAPIVLFTNIEHLPIIVQYPTITLNVHTEPIYLTFDQVGAHYGVAIPILMETRDKDDETVTSTVTCNCGRKSSKGPSCALELSKYATRCKCFNSKTPCSYTCRCSGCKNPYGTKPTSKPITINKRKRHHHPSQQFPLKSRKTTHFMKDIGEEIITGIATDIEFLIVAAIINSMSDSFERRDPYAHLDSIHQLYCTIVFVLQAMNIRGPINSRSKQEIGKIIKQFVYILDIFMKVKVPSSKE